VHTNEEPARFQAACRNGFFRRGTGAFETWNRRGRRCSPRFSRLRLGGLCTHSDLMTSISVPLMMVFCFVHQNTRKEKDSKEKDSKQYWL